MPDHLRSGPCLCWLGAWRPVTVQLQCASEPQPQQCCRITTLPPPPHAQGNTPVLGVLHVPVSGETFFAVQGRGAFVRREVSARRRSLGAGGTCVLVAGAHACRLCSWRTQPACRGRARLPQRERSWRSFARACRLDTPVFPPDCPGLPAAAGHHNANPGRRFQPVRAWGGDRGIGLAHEQGDAGGRGGARAGVAAGKRAQQPVASDQARRAACIARTPRVRPAPRSRARPAARLCAP
jgi:hypothetical protein